MKRSHQILFIVSFLSIVYTVPVVQTSYEFLTNTNHRIQILDLFSDVFVTPAQKAAADAAAIDSLSRTVAELGASFASSRDTASSWDPQGAIEQCDESIIKVTMLKKSVVDFNRHVQGAANRFAARDTAKPYYSSLIKFNNDLESTLTLLQSSSSPAAITTNIEKLQADIAAVRQSFGKSGGVTSYVGLTLSALRRIMVGADYLRPYEKEMEKSSIFANSVRPWLLAGYFALFGDLGSKGLRGINDWLFYRIDVDYIVRPDVLDVRSRIVDANDDPLTEDIVGSIVSFKNDLAKRGIDIIFVVMPTKAAIYPDLLSKGMRPESSGTIGPTPHILKVLQEAGVETVDLFAALAAERANDRAAGDSLYLRTDTHFKNRAVRAVARAIADKVKQYPWFTAGTTEYECDSVVVTRKGDIAEMTDFPPSVMRNAPKALRPESTLCFQVYRVSRDATGAVADRILYKDDFVRSQILVLGDSFSRIYQTDQPKGAGWIAHLARELSQPVASIVNDGGASTLVRQVLARKPQTLKNKKLVIWEVVERDFRYGEEGWKKVVLP
ncbi:MAG: hypothetical protein MUF22_01770 [Chitinispirillaceae bacterium]|jgi:hypothetical protein|nr:hypothetical protein [Chitinispirillaceae bacterium]